MADGSHESSTDPKNFFNSTLSFNNGACDDTKECREKTVDNCVLNLSTKNGRDASKSCEDSEPSSVVSVTAEANDSNYSSQDSSDAVLKEVEERKKRCFDRYDSSESSDSGVVVLSPTESSGSGSSDITDPGSPRSPESFCGVAEEGASARMPPWASETAPPGPRRHTLPPQVPARRPPQPLHRRITEYFNHKMKPQNGIKREANTTSHEEPKRKCLPTKNGVAHDLEIYISYLSKTLTPRLRDIGKTAETTSNKAVSNNEFLEHPKKVEISSKEAKLNGLVDFGKQNDNEGLDKSAQNFPIQIKKAGADSSKDKQKFVTNGLADKKLQHSSEQHKIAQEAATNSTLLPNKQAFEIFKRRLSESCVDLLDAKTAQVKPDSTKNCDIPNSTTKYNKKSNGLTYDTNSVTLTPIAPKLAPGRKESPKKATQAAKRTNRKSSACIANSKNMTWSKANNLKQAELQKQNCINTTPTTILNGIKSDSSPKINIANTVNSVPLTMNGVAGLNNLNIPPQNFQNCHQISIQQPCTVSSTNLASFVAVPQNVMLTTLRIPQNGLTTQSVNQQHNMAAFAPHNVNVSSPTKLNGQFVFPLMQNINGTVVQIPSLMAKMPNFVLPQSTQLQQQRHDHMQNQQAQILINGTLLKLANTMPSTYANVNKPLQTANQTLQGMNKNVSGMPTVSMTVQPKPSLPNYTVNFSHSVLVPQPGFIVTSVPNMNVKETWSSSSGNSAPSTQNSSCSNPIVQYPRPLVTNYSNQALHTSSIPIAPVKPPDNPIQGTDPPSSTFKEPENEFEKLPIKCDMPWLTKTVNNNIVPLDSNKFTRPFAQVRHLSEKLAEVKHTDITSSNKTDEQKEASKARLEKTIEEIRRVEEVARREETIFTQITVLKDVSSNVQNSVIESNYSRATPESSESGIGTDKSIDSPLDSHGSKECDEDSSLSLSVSVCSVDVPISQKSPILKEPKTLRFPPKLSKTNNQRTSSTDTTSTVTVCLWENCKTEFENDTDLLEHLQVVHVETQAGQENYTCQWLLCKVKGKPSCSRLWLERHALSHGGNKPFKCIVDGCGKRFTTQILLERHVNNHFNVQSPNTGSSKKSTDSAPKLIRRNGKKLRYRRQPWSARMFDFFDAGTMEGLAWRLTRATRWRLGGSCPFREPAGRHTLTLHAALTATRYNVREDRREALLSYYPPHVLDDEWVPESEVKLMKRVEIAELPTDKKISLYEQFCSSYRKAASPPPKQPVTPQPSSRVLPTRQCTSSRLLNNLITKSKETKSCPSNNMPMVYKEDESKAEVSGAKKRKMGRRYGGNAFWPCGR